MDDRALLEAAARAAAIDLDLTLRPDGKPLGCSERGLAISFEPGWWNPLTDDADALRLAVKLNLDVDICFSQAGVCYVFKNEDGDDDADHVLEQLGEDKCAGVRRAIVRAAAALAQEPA